MLARQAAGSSRGLNGTSWGSHKTLPLSFGGSWQQSYLWRVFFRSLLKFKGPFKTRPGLVLRGPRKLTSLQKNSSKGCCCCQGSLCTSPLFADRTVVQKLNLKVNQQHVSHFMFQYMHTSNDDTRPTMNASAVWSGLGGLASLMFFGTGEREPYKFIGFGDIHGPVAISVQTLLNEDEVGPRSARRSGFEESSEDCSAGRTLSMVTRMPN